MHEGYGHFECYTKKWWCPLHVMEMEVICIVKHVTCYTIGYLLINYIILLLAAVELEPAV